MHECRTCGTTFATRAAYLGHHCQGPGIGRRTCADREITPAVTS